MPAQKAPPAAGLKFVFDQQIAHFGKRVVIRSAAEDERQLAGNSHRRQRAKSAKSLFGSRPAYTGQPNTTSSSGAN